MIFARRSSRVSAPSTSSSALRAAKPQSNIVKTAASNIGVYPASNGQFMKTPNRGSEFAGTRQPVERRLNPSLGNGTLTNFRQTARRRFLRPSVTNFNVKNLDVTSTAIEKNEAPQDFRHRLRKKRAGWMKRNCEEFPCVGQLPQNPKIRIA